MKNGLLGLQHTIDLPQYSHYLIITYIFRVNFQNAYRLYIVDREQISFKMPFQQKHLQRASFFYIVAAYSKPSKNLLFTRPVIYNPFNGPFFPVLQIIAAL